MNMHREIERRDTEIADLKAQRDALVSCMEDHKRLVRELDVLINGEDGAARQASLCDLVAQVRAMLSTNNTKCTAHGGYAFQSDCGMCRAIAKTKAGSEPDPVPEPDKICPDWNGSTCPRGCAKNCGVPF